MLRLLKSRRRTIEIGKISAFDVYHKASWGAKVQFEWLIWNWGMTEDLDIEVTAGKDLTANQIADIMRLFDQSYSAANHAYLLKSFDVMRWIALAHDGQHLVGFAVGDAVETMLPRLDEPQLVAMAGIACIDTRYRRGGLFGRLALASMMGSGLLELHRRYLLCGRMAHAASYRAAARSSNNVVPLAGQPITAWHREMIECIAALYKVNVDSMTSRVIGKGDPIGYPKLEYEATADELTVFRDVDRNKGDSLLAMSWRPDPPAGWLDPD